MAVPPNYGVDFLTDYRGYCREVRATYGKFIMNIFGKPVECHICGRNHYGNKLSDKYKSDASSNK